MYLLGRLSDLVSGLNGLVSSVQTYMEAIFIVLNDNEFYYG